MATKKSKKKKKKLQEEEVAEKKKKRSKGKKKKVIGEGYKDGNDEQEKELAKKVDLGISAATKSSIWVVVLFALAALSMMAFFEAAGAFGQYFVRAVEFLFGRAGFLIPLTLFGGGVAVLFSFHKERHLNVIIGLGVFLLSFLGIFHITAEGERPAGYVGQGFAWPFEQFLGDLAATLILVAVFIISLLITFDISLRKLAGRDASDEEIAEDAPVVLDTQELAETKQKGGAKPKQHTTSFAGKLLRMATHPGQQEFDFKKRTVSGGITPDDKKKKASKKAQSQTLAKATEGYEPPPLTLIESVGEKPKSGDIEATQLKIQKTFSDFGLEVEMGEAQVGPAVTQYTLKPPRGVNLTRLTALQSNLSLSLAAHPIRIEAPIPGKSLVGIEIPNKKAATVRIFEMLKALQEVDPPSPLTFPLGMGVDGKPVFTDLAAMPHLLVAGSTGSGKSIGVNNILISLIYRNSPDRVKFIMIDPKRVEMTPYNGIPHLLAPVVTDAKKSINVLKWATQEMDRRYELLSDLHVRNIHGYNEKIEKEGGDLQKLPFIVVVIDEMADIMSMYKKEVEAIIVRLAQMARAVGIHLITSTQRPSTDVVTGLIKANIPTRIAFKVATQVDSRTILDRAGADKLLGKGDMLFMAGDAMGLQRIQGTFVSDGEVNKVTKFLRKQNPEADYDGDVVGATTGDSSKTTVTLKDGKKIDMEDEFFEEAKQIVIDGQKGSASLLQRRLSVGYARAARLLDMLEQQGIVGPAEGSKPRKVLIGNDGNEEA